MENQESTTEKPQKGAWDSLEGYPKKVTFELDKPVVVSFAKGFTKPTEMPSVDGKGVFYIFDCFVEAEKSCIMTSAWTLLNGFKSHMPLAEKTLIITKKNVKGKNMYYISKPDKFGSPKVDSEETPVAEPVTEAETEIVE